METIPLALGQQEIYFAHLVTPLFSHPLTLAYRVRGPFDVAAATRAMQALVRRHAALRLTFDRTSADDWTQQVAAPDDVRVEVVRQHLAGATEEQFVGHIRTLIGADARQWSIWNEPVFRFRILRRTDQDHLWLVSVQHLVADGPSLRIFDRDLWRDYTAGGYAAASDARPGPDFADVVLRQHEEAGDRLARNTAHWLNKLQRVPPVWQIGPPDRSRHGRSTRYIRLDAQMLEVLRSRCEDVSVNTLTAILWALAPGLFAVTEQNRVAVYLHVNSRLPQEQHVAGMFVATRPLLLCRDSEPADVRKELMRAIFGQPADPDAVLSAEIRRAYEFGVAPRRSVVVDYRRFRGHGSTLPPLQTNVREADVEQLDDLPVAPDPIPLRLAVYDYPDEMLIRFDAARNAVRETWLDAILLAFTQALREFPGRTGAVVEPGPGPTVGTDASREIIGDRGATLAADVAAIEAVIARHPGVRSVKVETVEEAGGGRRLLARVEAATALSVDELRAHCYRAQEQSPYALVPHRIEVEHQPDMSVPAGSGVDIPRWMELFRRHVDDVEPDGRFWFSNGTFATIAAIRRSARDAGLPVPAYRLFFGDRTFGQIAADATAEGDTTGHDPQEFPRSSRLDRHV